MIEVKIRKMKKTMLTFGILLLSIFLVSANSIHQEMFEEGKKLIDSKLSCDTLTDEQLESIGEYYMEKMHPGKVHEIMDQMMGGEGSESLKQMHINMAKRLYCKEDVDGMMDGGMMNMMMGGNMMGSGGMMNMMRGYGTGWQTPQTTMMGSLGYNYGYWNFINVLYIILLISIIVLVCVWILNLQKKTSESRKK